jgi:zinc transport system substrate-binding protein
MVIYSVFTGCHAQACVGMLSRDCTVCLLGNAIKHGLAWHPNVPRQSLGTRITTQSLGTRICRILAVFICVICGFARAEVFAAEPIRAIAGIPPAAYLAERIGGDRLQVETLIQPGQDPHTFDPAPKQIQALVKAKMFFKTGMPFENQLLEKISGAHPGLIAVDTAAGIKKIPMSAEHDHGGDDHRHTDSPDGLDPHVWLSPPLLKIQAANMVAALEKVDPNGAGFYKKNLLQLQRDLDELDAKIGKQLKPYAGRAFLVFHPAFGYFADCYGLKQEAIEAEGKQPTPMQLRQLIQKAKAERLKVVFVQPQFDRHSAQTVAEAIGGKIVLLNDMDKNILANLQDMADKIEQAFRESSTEK